MGAFAFSELVFIKEIAIGTALAVLVDATVVRALLFPALLGCSAGGPGGRLGWAGPMGDAAEPEPEPEPLSE